MDQDVTGENEQSRENTDSGVEGQDRGRLGQTMSVGRNGGQERTHGVDKMDTEGNSQEAKSGRRRVWVGLARVERIMVLDWG